MSDEKKKEQVSLYHEYDCAEDFWEQAARRLYEYLNPTESWYAFPADQRYDWIRALRGL